MQSQRFDLITKGLARRFSRRSAVQGGAASVLAAALGVGIAGRGVLAQEGTPEAMPAASPIAGACAETTPDENKALARQYFDAWQRADRTALEALLAADYVHHWGIGADSTGAEAMGERVAQFATAFPDQQFSLDAFIAEGDLVVVRWTLTGTQQAAYQGVPPTATTATWTGINIFRVACGRLAEGWSEADHLGRLIRIGVITPDELGSVGTPTP